MLKKKGGGQDLREAGIKLKSKFFDWQNCLFWLTEKMVNIF